VIKELQQPLSIIATAMNLPVVTDALIQKHVANGAVLYLVVDEDLFMTEDSASILYAGLSKMQELGATQKQSMLVIKLMSSASARPYDQLRYWQRSGGIAIALEPNEVDPFFKAESRWIEGE
jgi:hypothetical protein